jgi:XTP/dITP diphosphohydrolase
MKTTRPILYLATGNAHKVEEFAQLLRSLPLTLKSATAIGGMPAVEETANTFEGNALLKAEALYRQAPAGAWVMADDSGLETDALQGGPGVLSARFAGENASDADNCALLLQQMQSTATAERSARFRCVLALLGPNAAKPLFFCGACEGFIASEPTGAGGFGYDPLFIPTGYNASFAALAPEIKASISHRAEAIRKFCDWLKNILNVSPATSS